MSARRPPWWHAAVDWTAVTDWWTDPALAYLAGLQHGVQLERDRQWVEADHDHREAVARALAYIAVCETRDRWQHRRGEYARPAPAPAPAGPWGPS